MALVSAHDLTMTAEFLAQSATQTLEQTLEECLQSLLEMGICTSHPLLFPSRLPTNPSSPGASDVQESALETYVGGAASGYPGGLVGKKACAAPPPCRRSAGLLTRQTTGPKPSSTLHDSTRSRTQSQTSTSLSRSSSASYITVLPSRTSMG